MTGPQAMAVLIIRLWAVMAIIMLMYPIFWSITMLIADVGEHFQIALWSVAGSGPTLVFWLLVLRFAKPAAARMLPPRTDSQDRVRIESADLVRFGAFLIGVSYLGDYVPEFLQSTVNILTRYSVDSTYLDMSKNPGDWLLEAANLAAVGMALWLVFRPGSLVRLFAWLNRSGGTEGREAAEIAT